VSTSEATHVSHPRPRETLDRCALHAQFRGDPMLGTAFPAARLLLVEQPGPWGWAGLTASRFDHAAAAALISRAAAGGVRVLAIRRPGRTPPATVRRWALVDCRPGRESVRWGRYWREEELLDLPLDGSAGEASTDLAYLVCTHGKHDVCCALRGRGVAAALHDLRPGQVWECSHVGGERFAANVLVLPSGLLYGRVLAFSAAEFIATAEAGEVVGALLRGRVGQPPAAQAALAFAYEALAVRRVDAVSVVDVSPVRDGRAVVRLAGPHGLIDVTVLVEGQNGDRLTCGQPGIGWFLAYRPVNAIPVTP
jgi:Sucrase/ferredoxin-like